MSEYYIVKLSITRKPTALHEKLSFTTQSDGFAIFPQNVSLKEIHVATDTCMYPPRGHCKDYQIYSENKINRQSLL